MPVIRYIPQDPTDTVLQGEQFRIPNEDARPSYYGNVILGPDLWLKPTPITQDEEAFLPMNQFIEINQLSIRRNKDEGWKIRSNAGIASPCGAWVPVDFQPLILGRPGGYSRYTLSGVSRDSLGAVLGSCTVKIFRTINDTKMWELVSDATTGAWSIQVSELGPFYYVEYKVGTPDVAGTSINTNVPAEAL